MKSGYLPEEDVKIVTKQIRDRVAQTKRDRERKAAEAAAAAAEAAAKEQGQLAPPVNLTQSVSQQLPPPSQQQATPGHSAQQLSSSQLQGGMVALQGGVTSTSQATQNSIQSQASHQSFTQNQFMTGKLAEACSHSMHPFIILASSIHSKVKDKIFSCHFCYPFN